jgi:phage protein U
VPVPMIDDIELQATQCVRQETDQAFVRHQVAGLDGTVHQKLGRRSHRVLLSGLLLPETAVDDLKTLQEKASSGSEVTFAADIATALEVEHMVIESLAVEQEIGAGGQYAYTIELVESPPLPPPAELSSFGGLGDFGFGDLGFDAGALGDLTGELADQAGALAGAVEAALDAVEQLGGLAALADLGSLSNPLTPLTEAANSLAGVGSAVSDALGELGGLLE